MALKPQMILGGLALLFLMMPKGASAAPPRGIPPRTPPDPEPWPGPDPDYERPSSGDSATEALQKDLNDLRDELADAADANGVGAFEPFRALVHNNGPAGQCTDVGRLVEDGIDGPCTQNALTVADKILYSAYVVETLPDAVDALDAGRGLTFSDVEPPKLETYDDSLRYLAETVQYLHEEDFI